MSTQTAPDIELVADWLSGGDVDPSVVLWGADLDRYRGFLVGRDAPSLRGCTLIQCHTEDPGLVAKIARDRPNRIDIWEDTPYDYNRATLYTPDDMTAGWEQHGFDQTFDAIVYRHYKQRRQGAPPQDLIEALSQSMHDTIMARHVYQEVLEFHQQRPDGTAGPVVGIMGGNVELRGSQLYYKAAHFAREASGSGMLIATGGGPGIMEAGNLGSYFSQRSPEELDTAIGMLAQAPDRNDTDSYFRAALAVREQFPPDTEQSWTTQGGLALPTWKFSHEPVNLFSGKIAKFFSNPQRENMLLKICSDTLVVFPGNAGTVDEVFQHALRNYYSHAPLAEPPSYLFVDEQGWGTGWRTHVVEALHGMMAVASRGDMSRNIAVLNTADELVAHLQQRPTEPAPSNNGRDYLVVTGEKLDDAVEILHQRGTHASLRRGRAAEAAGVADALRVRAARAGLHLGPSTHRSVQASARPGDRGPRAAR